jgi:hypothetical protein
VQPSPDAKGAMYLRRPLRPEAAGTIAFRPHPLERGEGLPDKLPSRMELEIADLEAPFLSQSECSRTNTGSSPLVSSKAWAAGWFPASLGQSGYDSRLRGLVELLSIVQRRLSAGLRNYAAASSEATSPGTPPRAMHARSTASCGVTGSHLTDLRGRYQVVPVTLGRLAGWNHATQSSRPSRLQSHPSLGAST